MAPWADIAVRDAIDVSAQSSLGWGMRSRDDLGFA
jgi:hypothetical protein